MTKPPGPREAALRAMREARFEERSKVHSGIQKAAAAGKEVLERSVKAAAKRIKSKKKAKKK